MAPTRLGYCLLFYLDSWNFFAISKSADVIIWLFLSYFIFFAPPDTLCSIAVFTFPLWCNCAFFTFIRARYMWAYGEKKK